MKKLNLIKAMSTIGILGGITIAITTSLTSCSKGTTVTFRSASELTDFFFNEENGKCKIYQADFNAATATTQDYINYFAKGNRLWGYNVLCQDILSIFYPSRAIPNDSPLTLNFDNISDKSGKWKLEKDFSIMAENKKITYFKGTSTEFKISDDGFIDYRIHMNALQEDAYVYVHDEYEGKAAFLPNDIDLSFDDPDLTYYLLDLEINDGDIRQDVNLRLPVNCYPNIKNVY